MTLDQLSAAATEAQRLLPEFYLSPFYKTEYARPCDKVKAAIAFTLTRTGQLVAVSDDVIERVARTLAPNLEGGREFDQMPKDRAQLRQWTAQGMCLINDATQDDATWLAKEAIAALAAKGTGDE